MVYAERTEKCISSQSNDNGHNTAKSAYAPKTSSSSSTTQSSSSWSKNASDAEKWKYNDMARNQRDKFNNMHLC